jgi:hypothetical protein
MSFFASGSACLLLTFSTSESKPDRLEQAAEKVIYFVIPNAVRNLSLV